MIYCYRIITEFGNGLQIKLPHCYYKNYCVKNMTSYLFCGKVYFTTLLRNHSHTAIAFVIVLVFLFSCFHVHYSKV